jgi:hypothetical protein
VSVSRGLAQAHPDPQVQALLDAIRLTVDNTATAMARLATQFSSFSMAWAAVAQQQGGGPGGWYARGGPVPGVPASRGLPQFPGGTRGGGGMDGFAGRDQVQFAAGTGPSGLRWWALGDDGMTLGPALDDGARWDFSEVAARAAVLQGSFQVWEAGWQRAVCRNPDPPHGPDQVPFHQDERGRRCGCGWWVYWTVDGMPPPLGREAGWDVLGVVETDGDTLIGDLGCRAERARIVALHVATAFEPGVQLDAGHRRVFDAAVEWWRSAVEIALEARYEVPVYPTAEAMLAAHPVTTSYLPAGHGRGDPDRLTAQVRRARPVVVPKTFGSPGSSGGLIGNGHPSVLSYAQVSGLRAALRPGPGALQATSPGWTPVTPTAPCPSFRCPACGRVSYHPEDVRQGYCGACHDWTGTQPPPPAPGWRVANPIDAIGWLMDRKDDPAAKDHEST